LQLRILTKEIQLVEQLEEVIHDIRKLMLNLEEEVVSKEKLDRGEPT
jgi:hypothetical protein